MRRKEAGGMIYRLCNLCGKFQKENLNIFGRHICFGCEKRLMKREMNKADYLRWIEAMRG
jgi:hypothetical protein